MNDVIKLVRAVLHAIDYVHIRWGMKERLRADSVDFARASRRIYDYRRTYGWR